MMLPVTMAILAQLSPTPTSRTIHQIGSDWQISYSFAYPASSDPAPLIIPPSDLSARLTSPGLSNTRPGIPDRPAAHAVPRPVVHSLDGHAPASLAALRGLPDGEDRCAERAGIAIWSDAAAAVTSAFHRQAPPEDFVGPPERVDRLAGPPGESATARDVVVQPGGLLNVRVTLKHEHAANDGVDPLLGRRDLTLKVGPFTYRDTLDLSHEQYHHLPEPIYRPMDHISPDNLDDGIYFSPPTSLVLDAGEPGRQYYRFPERHARGGVRMRLRLRYLVPPDCDGELRVRISQYRESPNQWKVLSDGGFERVLYRPAVVVAEKPGKRGGGPPERAAMVWKVHEEVFTTQPETTTVATDVRLSGAESGIAWIDDVAVDYAGGVGNRERP